MRRPRVGQRARRRSSRPRPATAGAAPDSRTASRPSWIAGRRHRQRLAAPFVGHPDRLVGRALEHARRLGLRQRQALERDFGEDAERAERAGHEPRHVEARDVLHHAAAERQVLAAAVEDPHAEHEVAHRAGVGAPRPGQPAATAPPSVAPSPKCGGSNASIWPARAHRRARSSRERRAGARRDHELGRIVVDDAGVGVRVEHVAGERLRRRNPWCRRRGCAAASAPPPPRGSAPASLATDRRPSSERVGLRPRACRDR